MLTWMWTKLRRLVRRDYVLELQPGTTLTVPLTQVVRFRSVAPITIEALDQVSL